MSGGLNEKPKPGRARGVSLAGPRGEALGAHRAREEPEVQVLELPGAAHAGRLCQGRRHAEEAAEGGHAQMAVCAHSALAHGSRPGNEQAGIGHSQVVARVHGRQADAISCYACTGYFEKRV